jgi:hypothetical protein
MKHDPVTGMHAVDQTKPLGRDESAFLNALFTAVCRPSVLLAPGVLVRAAPLSGSGVGKGLLSRCMCKIAYGSEPYAVTAGGGSPEELDKRISAELMQASPVLLLDNLNRTKLKSDVLASALTEGPSRVRLLGKSQMVPLNSSAFIIVTGNGIELSEDLVRRFLVIELDARTEHPEARSFTADILREVGERRTDLLADMLTILRWGRITRDLKRGRSLGNYQPWCSWVRDPLLALGCQDPVERIIETKARDSERQHLAEVLRVWWDRHGDHQVTADQLHLDVKRLMDPNNRGRQYISSEAQSLCGTRLDGFHLIRHKPSKWTTATYVLQKTNEGRLSDGTE